MSIDFPIYFVKNRIKMYAFKIEDFESQTDFFSNRLKIKFSKRLLTECNNFDKR